MILATNLAPFGKRKKLLGNMPRDHLYQSSKILLGSSKSELDLPPSPEPHQPLPANYTCRSFKKNPNCKFTSYQLTVHITKRNTTINFRPSLAQNDTGDEGGIDLAKYSLSSFQQGCDPHISAPGLHCSCCMNHQSLDKPTMKARQKARQLYRTVLVSLPFPTKASGPVLR